MWQSITVFLAWAKKGGGLVLLCMAVVVGLWSWRAIFSQQVRPPVPRSALVLTQLPAQAAAEVAAQSWFGMAASTAGGQAPDITVSGILSGRNGSDRDFVLVQESGQSLMLRIGQQTPAGWTLRQLLPQSIQIEKAGVVHELPLSRQAGAPPSAVAFSSESSVPQQLAPAASGVIAAPASVSGMPPATMLLQD